MPLRWGASASSSAVDTSTRQFPLLLGSLFKKEEKIDILALRLRSKDTADEQIALIRVTPLSKINRNDPI